MYQRPTEGESVALTQAAHAGTFITSATVSSLSRPAPLNVSVASWTASAVAAAVRSPSRAPGCGAAHILGLGYSLERTR